MLYSFEAYSSALEESHKMAGQDSAKGRSRYRRAAVGEWYKGDLGKQERRMENWDEAGEIEIFLRVLCCLFCLSDERECVCHIRGVYMPKLMNETKKLEKNQRVINHDEGSINCLRRVFAADVPSKLVTSLNYWWQSFMSDKRPVSTTWVNSDLLMAYIHLFILLMLSELQITDCTSRPPALVFNKLVHVFYQ